MIFNIINDFLLKTINKKSVCLGGSKFFISKILNLIVKNKLNIKLFLYSSNLLNKFKKNIKMEKNINKIDFFISEITFFDNNNLLLRNNSLNEIIYNNIIKKKIFIKLINNNNILINFNKNSKYLFKKINIYSNIIIIKKEYNINNIKKVNKYKKIPGFITTNIIKKNGKVLYIKNNKIYIK
ncbi:hypothetical protein ACT2CR_00100 [Candidatus Vidania fulgoroideorum]